MSTDQLSMQLDSNNRDFLQDVSRLHQQWTQERQEEDDNDELMMNAMVILMGQVRLFKAAVDLVSNITGWSIVRHEHTAAPEGLQSSTDRPSAQQLDTLLQYAKIAAIPYSLMEDGSFEADLQRTLKDQCGWEVIAMRSYSDDKHKAHMLMQTGEDTMVWAIRGTWVEQHHHGAGAFGKYTDIFTDILALGGSEGLSAVRGGHDHAGVCLPSVDKDGAITLKLFGDQQVHVHSGMWQVALLMFKDFWQQQYQEEFDLRGCSKLILTGHSLGAGLASLLAIIFHELMLTSDIPKFEVSCVGYCTPAVLSAEAAALCSPFVQSVVNADDLVPRLSGTALENLFDEVYGNSEKGIQKAVVRKLNSISEHSHGLKHVAAEAATEVIQTIEKVARKTVDMVEDGIADLTHDHVDIDAFFDHAQALPQLLCPGQIFYLPDQGGVSELTPTSRPSRILLRKGLGMLIGDHSLDAVIAKLDKAHAQEAKAEEAKAEELSTLSAFEHVATCAAMHLNAGCTSLEAQLSAHLAAQLSAQISAQVSAQIPQSEKQLEMLMAHSRSLQWSPSFCSQSSLTMTASMSLLECY